MNILDESGREISDVAIGVTHAQQVDNCFNMVQCY